MSTAQFTIPLIVTIPGQLITSSGWNGEFTNLYTNLNPLGIGAYSDTNVQMQTTSDPYPASVISRPTAISGELERIRYILGLIIGKTYWYEHPATDLSTVSAALIPSGTRMPFFQAAAPTGWTQITTGNSGAGLRVTDIVGGGGGIGGTNALSTPITLSHSHTVDSHTHDISTHAHLMKNHTHTSAAHTHSVPKGSWSVGGTPSTGDLIVSSNGSTQPVNTAGAGAGNTSGSTTPGVTGAPSDNTTNTSDTANTGAATPGTDTALSNWSIAYIDVIVCSKN